jgi:hypothetical protein
MFVVVEARIEARLSMLDIRVSFFVRASCFDTSVATHIRLTIRLNWLRNLSQKTIFIA